MSPATLAPVREDSRLSRESRGMDRLTGHTSTAKERLSFSELEQFLTKVNETIQVWWQRLMKRIPIEKLDRMKASDTTKTDVSESSAYSFVFHLLQLIYAEPSEKAKIFEILNEKIFDKTLAYLITKAIESDSTNPLMLGLQSALFEKWLAQKATPKEVKSMLQEATQSNSDSERKIYDQIAYQYEKFFGKVKITVEDSGTSGEVKLDPSS